MDRFDRGVLSLVGACFIAASLLTGVIWYDNVGIDLFPQLWPFVFSVSGITTIAWAARPDSYVLFRVSGLTAISSLVARAVNSLYVVWEMYEHYNDLTFTLAQMGVRLCLFLMLAVLVSYTWSAVWERFAGFEEMPRDDTE